MKQNNFKNGFTLIELIITITIMAVIITVLTGVLVSVVRAQLRTQSLGEVKRNGDSTIAIIQEAVRTSKQVQVNPDNTINFTTQADKDYVLGFVPGITPAPPADLCDGGGTNGYIYLVEGIAPGANISEEISKVTNDNKVDGVNVTDFTAYMDVNSATPLVEVTMEVNKAVCSKYLQTDVARTFKSTISARAFFNN